MGVLQTNFSSVTPGKCKQAGLSFREKQEKRTRKKKKKKQLHFKSKRIRVYYLAHYHYHKYRESCFGVVKERKKSQL